MDPLGWFKRLFKRTSLAEAEETREPTKTERRIVKIMSLVEKVIRPWKKALEARDRIIVRLTTQRDQYKDRLDEYVTALKERDRIIVDLAEKRDDLLAERTALEMGERPPEDPEVSAEHVVPDSPGDVPAIVAEASSSDAPGTSGDESPDPAGAASGDEESS